MNDLDFQRLGGYVPQPRSAESELKAFESWNDNEDGVFFIVYEVATWQPIGFASLMHIDAHHRSAEFGIGLGESSARGKGYGTETAMLVLDYAFTVRGLHSVYLTTAAYNVAGQRAYQNAGFKEVGRLREAAFMGGRFWDVIYMDCLASEFSSPLLSRTFTPPHEEG
jgi:RimJ/RimL family protein N-acetyltransferase